MPGIFGLALAILGLASLVWSVFVISGFVSRYILTVFRLNLEVAAKNLYLLSFVYSLGIALVFAIFIFVSEYFKLQASGVYSLTVYILGLVATSIFVLPVLKNKNLLSKKLILFFGLSSLVSLALWTVIFALAKSYILFIVPIALFVVLFLVILTRFVKRV